MSCLAALAPVLVASVAEAQDLTSLRFLAPGLTINGQAPAVFFERDAEQILTAQVFYEVDYGYGVETFFSSGRSLSARIRPS